MMSPPMNRFKTIFSESKTFYETQPTTLLIVELLTRFMTFSGFSHRLNLNRTLCGNYHTVRYGIATAVRQTTWDIGSPLFRGRDSFDETQRRIVTWPNIALRGPWLPTRKAVLINRWSTQQPPRTLASNP